MIIWNSIWPYSMSLMSLCYFHKENTDEGRFSEIEESKSCFKMCQSYSKLKRSWRLTGQMTSDKLWGWKCHVLQTLYIAIIVSVLAELNLLAQLAYFVI
jgi:hypothetical protein